MHYCFIIFRQAAENPKDGTYVYVIIILLKLLLKSFPEIVEKLAF